MKIIEVDEDVGKIAQYMEDNLPATHLYRVAKALSQVADLIWLHHHDSRERFHAFGLLDKD
jgi:hypothetical protein